MTTTLYMFEISPPARAAWLTCRAVGLDCTVKSLNLLKQEHMTEDFLKINPIHTVPTLDDKGFHVFESRAIMGYVADKYAKDDFLYPKDPKKRAIVNQYMYWDLGTLFKTARDLIVPHITKGGPLDEAKKEDVAKALKHLNDTFLGDKKAYVMGDHMSIADLTLAADVSFLDLVNFDLSPYPNITAWMAKMKALPYFKECTDGMYKVRDTIVANRG